MLRDLLQTQVAVQSYSRDFSLINDEELGEIRRKWLSERQDWSDSLPKIYEEVFHRVS